MPIVTTPPSNSQDEGPKFSFNKVAVATKLQALTERMNSFIGKKNHNPFLWVKENLEPLIKRFQKGEASQELQDKVMSIPDDVTPSVNPSAPSTTSDKTVDESSAGPRNEAPKLTPAGLNIPVK